MLTIILVNYKSSDLSLNCISSIYELNPDLNPEIILVDNDSNDRIEEEVIKQFHSVKFIQMGYNAGFGRANNRGIQQATGDTILFLNNDTICVDDSIQRAYTYQQSEKLAGLGIKLLNPDGSIQHSGFFFVPYALNFLLNIPYFGRFFCYSASMLKMKKPFVESENLVEEVDWINGAFLMIPRKAIDLVGEFDEDFFLYSEETEFCSRLRKYGKLKIRNDMKIIHLQGESVGRKTKNHEKGYSNLSGRKGLQILVSGLLRIRKQYGILLFLIHLTVYTLSIPFIFIMAIFESIFSRDISHFVYSINVGKNILWIYRFCPSILISRHFLYKVI